MQQGVRFSSATNLTSAEAVDCLVYGCGGALILCKPQPFA